MSEQQGSYPEYWTKQEYWSKPLPIRHNPDLERLGPTGARGKPEPRKHPSSVAPGKEIAADVWKILDDAGNLLITKHNDYGPRNISGSPGGPLNGLRVRMWDKIARINNLLENNKDPENESLKDSFIDLLNYSVIAIMVIEGKWPKE